MKKVVHIEGDKFKVACEHCGHRDPFVYDTAKEAKMVTQRDAEKLCPVCER